MAQEITDKNYKELISKSKSVVVYFNAPWCRPCNALAPIFEQFYSDNNQKAIIGKVNTDNSPYATLEFGVRSVPTILFFKNGNLLDRHIGAATLTQLEQKLSSIL